VRRPSGFIEPCLPTKVARPPSGPLWVHEIKHDGYRLMVRRDAHRVFTAAQNWSVTAAVSSVTFQSFVSAFSLANLCSI
jgi:ATP-dependent DNA ligase